MHNLGLSTRVPVTPTLAVLKLRMFKVCQPRGIIQVLGEKNNIFVFSTRLDKHRRQCDYLPNCPH
jgi:hypothetical protein